ncbi:DUF6586 family protein [Agitococcus lubricus]|uniref:HEPN domain-containing protein n=1 Tax=Agitococcus lubricus TaxID=1077255 RepID=A0A2T5J1W6_9GAMM|nr:DUF6586 family protein [Agitococcus lubricus]PTQ90436.1 hypothetical protein C8N29_103189 [Agitococcus lubricus]
MRVARYGAGRTNQKFYFAKMAMQQLELAADEANKQAYYETAVFHLHGAFLACLQELSRFYKLSPQLATTEAIRLALDAKGQISPEISQLQAVETEGWLAELQQAFADCQLAPDPVEVQPEAELADSLILKVADASSSSAIIPSVQLQGWYKALHALINDFRREMVEF